MIKSNTSLVVLVVLSSLTVSGIAQDTPSTVKSASSVVKEVEKKCPVTGKASSSEFSTEYEGEAYTFCSDDCRKEFSEARKNSLYEKIGGKAALDAAVDQFYVKVLKDERVNFFFEDVNMKRQHNRQKAFIAAALGAPKPWKGKDMRKAHASMEIKESHFNVIAEHLQTTLEELKVPNDLVAQVMAVVGSTKDAILNKAKPPRTE
ncbi:MAG: hemoglobin [Verrucomicrobiales bacterium]|jgi:hemoglobin